MAERATFTLDKENIVFLQKAGGKNKSAYINALLKREQQKSLEEQYAKANQEEADDPHYQEELSDWEDTLPDGLSDRV